MAERSTAVPAGGFDRGLLPFSDPEAFYDSSAALGSVVEHTTSWLTINPIKGCSLGCAYCFRARWHPATKPEAQHETETAVKALLRHPQFVPHQTPLAINVSSTDAMLPTVRETTLRALELLDDHGVRNPVGITTKLRLHDETIAFLTQLKNVRPIVFISLALLPRNIEPVPVQPRVDNLRRLAEAQIPRVLYMRPIVGGWNDSKAVIEKLLGLGERYCDAICVGGLRLSPEIEQQIADAGVDIPSRSAGDAFHEKEVPLHVEQMIGQLCEELHLTVPIYKHTSCAVSRIMGWPNYNALYRSPKKNCVETCPVDQIARCRDGTS